MNLSSIIDRHPAEAVAFSYRGRSVTYGELRRSAVAVHAGLAIRGIGEGERVGIALGSEPGFAAAYLGVLRSGAVAVPLNPHSPPAELGAELSRVRAATLLAAEGAGALATAAKEAGIDALTLGELQQDTTEPPPPVDRTVGDPAALLFTSGTAGSPRAAVLTHQSLLANIEQIELRVGLAATADDVGVLAVPPFHILGLNAVLGVQLFAGGRLVLLDRFDPLGFLQVVAEEGVTIIVGVPQLFAALARLEGTPPDLSRVRLACSGAAPLPVEVAEAFEARYGLPVRQGYGLTEASAAVTFPDLSRPSTPASVGVPLPGIEVRIVDADSGDDVEPGDPGEILVRGPNVFAGYFEDAAASAAVLDRDGWLHTGDVAVMNDEGALTIVDRTKDLIIVSGFNVYPAEVEAALERHPSVDEAAVAGVPDAERGEAVKAFVVPVASAWPAGDPAPALGEDELIEHCTHLLARYKCPSSVSFVRELPRGLQGKLLRRAIA